MKVTADNWNLRIIDGLKLWFLVYQLLPLLGRLLATFEFDDYFTSDYLDDDKLNDTCINHLFRKNM